MKSHHLSVPMLRRIFFGRGNPPDEEGIMPDSTFVHIFSNTASPKLRVVSLAGYPLLEIFKPVEHHLDLWSGGRAG